MKPYASIDIETTGLDPSYCQILEIGCVLEDWTTPVEQLPQFHCYVRHARVLGQPFALAMNATILQKLALPGDPRTYLKPNEVGHYLSQWLNNHGVDPKKVVVAGKNFGGFDLQFLRRLPGFTDHVGFHHRAIDPSMFYWKPSIDDVPPSTEQCLTRAGLSNVVKHTAIEDALDVIRLIREVFSSGEPIEAPKPSAREVASKLTAMFRARGQIHPA